MAVVNPNIPKPYQRPVPQPIGPNYPPRPQPSYAPQPAAPRPAPRPVQRPPAPRQPTPLPLDPTYTLATAAALRQYQTTQAGLKYQRQRTQQEFGFDDPSDPYNRAAMLERSYHQAQSGSLNQGAARGQLYSGALQSNLDEGRYQYERNRAGLRKQYEDLLHNLTQQEAQAGSSYQQTLAGARGDAIQRALQNRPEDPGAPNYTKQYARLDQIRGFLRQHPDLRRRDTRRYARLIQEATGLKQRLPSRK
jgi:hypothetical protein